MLGSVFTPDALPEDMWKIFFQVRGLETLLLRAYVVSCVFCKCHLLGIWVLFSCWTLLLSRVSTMRTPPQMVVPPSPRSQPSTMQPASLLVHNRDKCLIISGLVFGSALSHCFLSYVSDKSVMSFHDPAVVCADVQAKMEQTLVKHPVKAASFEDRRNSIILLVNTLL